MEKIGRIPVLTRVDLHEKKWMHRKDKRANLKALLSRDEDMGAPGIQRLWLFLWVLGIERRAYILL